MSTREQVYQVLLVLFGLALIWGYVSLFITGVSSSLRSGTRHEEVFKTNKTLVVLMGSLRGGEETWSTLTEHVLDANHADLALLVSDASTRDIYQNASLFHRAKYHWTFPEYTDWADAIDLMNNGSASWRERVLPYVYESGYILGGVTSHGNQYGSGAIAFMLRWFLSNHLQEQQQDNNDNKDGLSLLQTYERFIITRSDHYYKCRHDISQLDGNYMWVPAGEDYGGITDRHLVASRAQILPALDIFPPILKDPQRYAHLLNNTYGNNVEKIIDYRWKEQGLPVQRFSRMMFTCGQDGDVTRMKGLGVPVREGVRLKYEKEYVASYATCGLQIGVD